MRPRGTGSLYEKHGNWYGRWRSAAGQRLNRKVGPVRTAHRADGFTRGEAERRFREMQAAEDERPTPGLDKRHTVDEACSALRRKLAYVGVSKSYAANCERKQRLHIGPAMGEKELHRVTRRDVERLGEDLIARGLSPKTVRNTLTFLHQGLRARDRPGVDAREPGAARDPAAAPAGRGREPGSPVPQPGGVGGGDPRDPG